MRLGGVAAIVLGSWMLLAGCSKGEQAAKSGAGSTGTKKYRVARIEGLHHYLFTQDSIKTVVTTWMRYIESGYFD